MAIIMEEFIRCEKCGCPDFVKKEVYTFHKKLRPRFEKKTELDHLDKDIIYVCKECEEELHR